MRSPTAFRLAVIGVAALSLAAVGSVAPISMPSESASATAPPPTGAGIDISFPQCAGDSHVELPGNVPFAIVGVNGGIATRSNPCFLSEYNSALLIHGTTTEQPQVALYVNTGNPALTGTWWPDADVTQSGSTVDNPNGTCAHDAGSACAYVYGYSAAQADYRGVSSRVAHVPGLWWLDVETSNTWQADTAANAAVLTGMADYFRAKGLSVGLYSTSYQWNRIAGQTAATSPLAGLRSWLAGASQVGAPALCGRNPLTPGGWVSLIQYVGHFDNDVSCHRMMGASATITPSYAFGTGATLTAVTGNWTAGDVVYGYQWNRDGVAVAGATSSSYITTAADLGTTITVTVTGSAVGYDTTARTTVGSPVMSTVLQAE